MLFLPTLASNGTVLEINAESPCDYWVIMSTSDMSGGTKFKHEDVYPIELAECLPTKIIGRHFKGWYKNADTITSVEAIQVGVADSIHRRPFIGIWHG